MLPNTCPFSASPMLSPMLLCMWAFSCQRYRAPSTRGMRVGVQPDSAARAGAWAPPRSWCALDFTPLRCSTGTTRTCFPALRACAFIRSVPGGSDALCTPTSLPSTTRRLLRSTPPPGFLPWARGRGKRVWCPLSPLVPIGAVWARWPPVPFVRACICRSCHLPGCCKFHPPFRLQGGIPLEQQPFGGTFFSSHRLPPALLGPGLSIFQICKLALAHGPGSLS